MNSEPQTVKVIADELGDHLPVWFPAPIFDDESKMPITAITAARLREWNRAGHTRAHAPHAELDRYYAEGLQLARALARELGEDFAVKYLSGGTDAGWVDVLPEL